MGGSSILKQFLVALGFKVDALGLSRYNAAVTRTTSVTRNLGHAAVWAAATVVGAVAVISRQLEKLYFSSLKTGETVENINAFAYGMGAAGISADKARGMLEAFSLELLRNPGKVALLRNLGVTAENTAGQLDQLIGVLLKKFPGDRAFFARAAFAEQFGISPDDLRIMEKTIAERARENSEYKRLSKAYDVDLQKAAEQAHELDRAIAGLGARLSLMGTNFASVMQGPIKDGINMLNGLIDSLNALWIQSREGPGGGVTKPGDPGYFPGMPQPGQPIRNLFRALGFGLVDATMQGALRGREWAEGLEQSRLAPAGAPGMDPATAAAIDRAFAQAEANPGVYVTIQTRDPETTVEVDNGRTPLGAAAARNFATPAR